MADDELTQLEALLTASQGKSSAVHAGDTDSEDDEDRREGLTARYSEYGAHVNGIIRRGEQEQRLRRLDFEVRLRDANRAPGPVACSGEVPPAPPPTAPPPADSNSRPDVYADPVFGIRVTRPLVSGSALLERMRGRQAVTMARIKHHTEHGDLSKDWAIAGVIVRSSGARESRKGGRFVVWTLSDLRDDLKSNSLFLFGKAHAELWKTTVGTVVAVLNPSVLDRSEGRADQACLSVDSPERVLILGHSKDYGMCKSRKKDGEPCAAFVNVSSCQHCIYHVKQEYNKYSKRQELQSSSMGKGLVDLQKKVLGKSTVVYGGRAYSAIPSAKNKKILKQDQNRLMSLSDYYKTESDKLMMNRSPYGADLRNRSEDVGCTTGTQKIRDFDRLEKLHASPSDKLTSVTGPSAHKDEQTLAEKLALSSKFSHTKLSSNSNLSSLEGTVDLSINYGERAREKARADAAKVLQQLEELKKADPLSMKMTYLGRKRVLERVQSSKDSENDTKKCKVGVNNKYDNKGTGIMSDRFKKMLEATSAHQNLLERHEEAEQDKYFARLEKTEAMEEKMHNTFKLACKAVRCTACKYTSFSASDHCKRQRHPLKLLDAVKRFFRCGDCGRRTVCLQLLPLRACTGCGGSSWRRAPMLREKRPAPPGDPLSIRGEEETHIGGQVRTGKNINLLVPE